MNRAFGLVSAALLLAGCGVASFDGSPASSDALLNPTGRAPAASPSRTNPERVASSQDESRADSLPAPVVQLTDETFEQQVLMSDRPVLVDFCASWCGPCRRLEPTIDDLAREYDGKVTVAKVDIDMNRRLAERYNIRHTPTVIILRQGRVVEEVVGVAPKRELAERIATQLAAHAETMGQSVPVASLPEEPTVSGEQTQVPPDPPPTPVESTQASTDDPIPPAPR